MLGSANSISSANIALNTAVAESLKSYADRLENVDNFEEALHALIKKTIKDHKRIIFNGNGYDDEWIKEAEKRGLSNLPTTPDCLPALISEKSVELFANHKVFTREELEARYEIYLENYCKTLNIEALTMIDMVNKDILPAISEYIGVLSGGMMAVRGVCPTAPCSYEMSTVTKLSELSASVCEKIAAFEESLEKINSCSDKLAVANMYKDVIIPAMESIRTDVDAAESITASKYWPYPSYGDLLFSVQ